MTGSFFTEDTVVLKADPSITAVVQVRTPGLENPGDPLTSVVDVARCMLPISYLLRIEQPM